MLPRKQSAPRLLLLDLKPALNGLADVDQRFLLGSALGVTALQGQATGNEVAVLILFDNDRILMGHA